MTEIQIRFRVRRRTAASWTSLNEVLLDAELGLESDTDRFKFGDGVTAWNSLPYAVPTLDADLAALAAIGTTGLLARTGAGTATTRAVTGTANEITVANGDGVSGAPTISLPAAMTLTGKTVTGGTFSGVALSGTTNIPGSGAVDSSGRVGIGMTPAKALDITVATSGDGISLFRGTSKFSALADGSVTWNNGANGGQLSWDTNKAIVRANTGGTLSLQADGGVVEATFGTTGIFAVPYLRINQAATAAAVTQTHHAPIMINGVVYKLLLAT